MKKPETKKQVFAAFISAGIIVMLILAGPAQAFVSSLTVSESSVKQGEDVSFIASIDISSQEFLNITALTLEITGPKNVTCVFNADGIPITDCEDLEIQKISQPGFGYGYSYGYGSTNGILAFNISLDTTNMPAGNYSTALVLDYNSNKQTTTAGNNFEIITEGEENEKVTICHIPPGNPENAHTITISESALQAHLSHGDYLGECVNDDETGNGNHEDNETGNSGNNGNSGGNNNSNSNNSGSNNDTNGNSGEHGNSGNNNSDGNGNGNSEGNNSGNGKNK